MLKTRINFLTSMLAAIACGTSQARKAIADAIDVSSGLAEQNGVVAKAGLMLWRPNSLF